MTPQQKANELIVKYTSFGCGVFYENEDGEPCMTKDSMSINSALKCAIILVDEIISCGFGDGYNHIFWVNVKNELENKL